MELYRCELTLHDYLFFATTERGKVAETGPFIHNYALTYALGWAVAPWYQPVQQPHYREELATGERHYITPARLLRGSTLVSQYNTLGESYSLGKGRSIGYPEWGFIKCFRPGTVFRCYVISLTTLVFPPYLRLGKFMAKARLVVTPGQQVRQVADSLPPNRAIPRGELSILLNWDDLIPAARPVVYDVLTTALPTRLIDHPVFTGVPGPYLTATFADETVSLPLQMGYLGEDLCSSW